jgi:hypothetical protein
MISAPQRRCFVLSPIGKPDSDVRKHADLVLKLLIGPALREVGISATRADEMDIPGRITAQVIRAILDYDLCVAVLTKQNPNVFYELAIAQAARRRVVLLIEEGEVLPFDIQDYRVVKYVLDENDVNGGVSLKRLVAQIRAVLSPDYSPAALIPFPLSEPRRRIVFYAPTLKGNPFFHDILHHIVELASLERPPLEVVTRKSVGSTDPNTADRYCTRFLSEYDGKDVNHTVIVMIPPNPKTYDEILGLDPQPRLNLITLDIKPPDLGRLDRCEFVKHAIFVDSQAGARLAAERLLDFCGDSQYPEIGVILCEGEFHGRAQSFRLQLTAQSRDRGVKPRFLGDCTPLEFSNPRSAMLHVREVIQKEIETVRGMPTFVFCANDNLALGARTALSFFDERLKDVRIISFDYSDLVRELLGMRDPHLFGSVDQMYHEYAKLAVDVAVKTIDGQTIPQKVTQIPPDFHR